MRSFTVGESVAVREAPATVRPLGERAPSSPRVAPVVLGDPLALRAARAVREVTAGASSSGASSSGASSSGASSSGASSGASSSGVSSGVSSSGASSGVLERARAFVARHPVAVVALSLVAVWAVRAMSRAPRHAARMNPPTRRPWRRLDIFWDDSDRQNPGWAWSADDGDHVSSGPLPARRRRVSLTTLRRQLAAELPGTFPADARRDERWSRVRDGFAGWTWKP